jgi:hypothetical protein
LAKIHIALAIVFSFLIAHLVFSLDLYAHIAQAFLYDNGTCTNEKLKEELPNQIVNTSGTVDDFLKSLPSDNTVLAEIVCGNRTTG